MKLRIRTFVKWFLLVWGGFSLVMTVGFVSFIGYEVGIANRDEDDAATPHDVCFVLNWCDLGEQRIERVTHSHVSARSLTGDHLDAYAIKVSHVSVGELTADTSGFGSLWYRGDQLPKVLAQAVDFAGDWHDEIPWFPTEAQLESSDFYVYSWSITFHGTQPTAAELIFVRPSDQMVFYFGGKS